MARRSCSSGQVQAFLPSGHGHGSAGFCGPPQYRHLDEVLAAGDQLKLRFFKPDKYHDRKAPLCWTTFQYPFWWTSILTALDSLFLLGFPADDKDIQKALG